MLAEKVNNALFQILLARYMGKTKVLCETGAGAHLIATAAACAKFNFPFDLLSDSDEKACKIFDVIKEKNMYGRKLMGIERSTFLIDQAGKLRREWRKVKVKNHVSFAPPLHRVGLP